MTLSRFVALSVSLKRKVSLFQRNTVELPTLRLAREALPLLSTGWGVSLFAVGSSFAGLAVASFLIVLKLANGAVALVPASLAAFAVWLFCKMVILSRFVALSSR